MDKRTKVELAQYNAELERKAWLWELAYTNQQRGVKAAACENWRDEEYRENEYRATLYAPDAGHGGYVVLRHRAHARETYSVEYMDTWSANMRRFPSPSNLAARIAAERLEMGRSRALHPQAVAS